MSGLRSSKGGDMYVELSVETPSKLNKRQRELLGELFKVSGDDISLDSATFFEQSAPPLR